MDINKKSRKDYEKFLNSISPDRDDEDGSLEERTGIAVERIMAL